MKPSVKAGIDEENIKDLILLSALNDLYSGKGNIIKILNIVNIIRKKDRQKERGEIIALIMSQTCNTPDGATVQRKIIDLISKED